MRQIFADLHVHTVLSPCAEIEMIPPLIVRRALELELGLIAVTDHNAAANCAAVMRAAEGSGLRVLPGMEVQTREDIHVLCLFESSEQVLAWQGVIWDHLPDQANPVEHLGIQLVVDATGDYLRTEPRLLITAADLSLEEIVAGVRTLGGLPIPAHIDRPSFSLLVNLGFVPPELDVPALELFRLTEPSDVLSRRPELARWPLIRSSDAHQLSEMTPTLTLAVEEATLSELARALAGEDGRSFSLVSHIRGSLI